MLLLTIIFYTFSSNAFIIWLLVALSSHSIARCCTTSLYCQREDVGLARANWKGVFSPLSLALLSALFLSNNCTIAFLLYLATLWRGVYYFYSLLWCTLYNWADNSSATFVLLHHTEECKGISLSKPYALVSALCSSNSITTWLLP